MDPWHASRSEGSGELADGFAALRNDTFGILLAAVAALLWLGIVALVIRQDDFWPGWGTLDLMLAAVGGCFALRGRNYYLASGLFVVTLVVGLAVFLLAPEEPPFLPFLFAPTVLIAGTLLGSRAAFLTALVASVLLAVVDRLAGASTPASTALSAVVLVWLSGLTSWATARNLYTALQWSWEDSEEAKRNLTEARTYQGKLAAALRQIEEANYRLERANYALSWARAEADQSRRLKAQFAAHVSHELRTPINLVVGFAELMLNSPETYSGAPLPPAYQADLTALHRSARHLRALIDDILDISQIDAGEMPVLKDPAELGAIVHEAVATAGGLLDRKGLSIQVDLKADLPMLYVDRLRIRQVLLNLLNNAARFTDRGGVTIQARREGPEVVLEVTDTGIGIRPEDLERLFEPYHQLDSSPTSGRGGTGLGLAISRRFVELHGGRIWARSDGIPGKGSTFGFALPVKPADEPSRATPPGHFDPHYVLSAAPPAPVVVVLDDDPAVVGLFRRHLGAYQVVGAMSPEEAVGLASLQRAHALVVDLPSQGQVDEWQEGWTRLAGERGIRVLGCPMPSGRRVARALGLVDYLVKPVTREALLDSIRAVAPTARTILVVDDDPQMVRLLCGMLRSASAEYHLLRAYGGEEALGLVRRASPDLVLLDLLMPQVDGLTVLERMRKDPALAGVPVVAVSARGLVEAIAPSTSRTLTLVSDEVLPISRLLSLVQTILDHLPPVGAREPCSEPAPPGDPTASGASG